MGDAGSVRFPGSLDPMAEEFRPRDPYNHHQTTLVQPQIYYSYQPPSEVTVMPLSDGGGAVGFLQFPTALPYVRSSIANQPLPSPASSPTRTLILSLVPADVSASEVRRELEVFGDVRALQMERVFDGVVTVHFYDLRDAQAATREIRKQHMQQQSRLKHYFESLLAQNLVFDPMNLVAPLPPPGRGLVAGQAVWAQFTVPSMAGVPDGHNQGSLVIFNLDSEVSTPSLLEIFEAFGPVKELRETPMKRHQRFVEFYDVRHAAKALSEMNGKEIHGKHIKIEFSRPGGYGKRFSKATQTNKFNSNNFTSYANHSGRNSSFLPPPPPLQMARRSTASLPPHSLRGYANGAIQASMASLRVSGKVGNGIDDSDNRLPIFKNSNKIGSASQKQQEQRVPKISRPLRERGLANNLEPRFLINEDAILESSCRDSRTTVMIKNIPNKYSLKLLLNMLDNHCIHCNEQIVGDDQPLSSYDFVYLPIDFINKCNVGYGFVNLTSPQATWRLYKAFHLQNWEVFNSKKICQVTYARLQGVDAMKEHFKTSKFPYEVAEGYLPVVFSPPRDGRQLTEPVPVVARIYSQLTVSSEKSEADHDNGEDGPIAPINGHNVGHLNGNGSGGGEDKEGPAAETMVVLNECF